jgi:hypothetical protein
MPIPVLVGGAVAAAKSAAVADVTRSVGQAFAGLVGDTAKDKQRKQRAAGLTAAALAGDMGALRQLTYDAFTKSTGALGDDRRPDGTASPPASRSMAVAGLKQYVAKYGGLPQQFAMYAERLNADVVIGAPPLLEQVLKPAVDTITDAALDRAAERGSETAKKYLPLIIGGAIVLVAVVYVATRKKAA